MRNLNQDNITQAVIASFANTTDPRLKQIMTSLVQHLHAFVREVKLTEEEWFIESYHREERIYPSSDFLDK